MNIDPYVRKYLSHAFLWDYNIKHNIAHTYRKQKILFMKAAIVRLYLLYLIKNTSILKDTVTLFNVFAFHKCGKKNNRICINVRGYNKMNSRVYSLFVSKYAAIDRFINNAIKYYTDTGLRVLEKINKYDKQIYPNREDNR